MAAVREHLTDRSENLRAAWSDLRAIDEEITDLMAGVGGLPLSEAATRVSQGARTAAAAASKVLKEAKAAEAAAGKATTAMTAARQKKAAAEVAAAAAAAPWKRSQSGIGGISSGQGAGLSGGAAVCHGHATVAVKADGPDMSKDEDEDEDDNGVPPNRRLFPAEGRDTKRKGWWWRRRRTRNLRTRRTNLRRRTTIALGILTMRRGILKGPMSMTRRGKRKRKRKKRSQGAASGNFSTMASPLAVKVSVQPAARDPTTPTAPRKSHPSANGRHPCRRQELLEQRQPPESQLVPSSSTKAVATKSAATQGVPRGRASFWSAARRSSAPSTLSREWPTW